MNNETICKPMTRPWESVTMPEMNIKYFETKNRNFEGFAYSHRLYYDEIKKDEKSKMTVWVYKVTSRLLSIIAEFNDIVAKGY